MVRIPKDLKYSETHEWAMQDTDEDVVIVGITDYAQQQLGEVVHIELPEVDSEVAAGDEVCVVESVKAASDVYSPLSGRIVAVNEELEDAPGFINSDPYQDGWLYKIALKDHVEYDELYDAAGYKEYLMELEEED